MAILLLGGAAFLAAACAPADDDGRMPPSDRDTLPAPEPEPERPIAHDRPEEVEGIIEIEGFAEPFKMRLVRSPEGFPRPFSTYVPEDMIVDTAVSSAGHALRLIAAFGGVRNDNAFLEAFFHPARTAETEARRRVREFAEARGRTERRPEVGQRYAWSIEEHDFMQREPQGWFIIGTVALGSSDGRFFRFVLHYPEEYADGFGPRANRILEEWRWEDTGEFLGGERRPDEREPPS